MMHAFADGKTTPEVIEQELKLKPEDFDKEFLAWVEAQTKTVVEKFTEWKKRLRGINENAKAKKWDEVIKEGTEIRDWYTEYVEAGSVYEFLADAYEAKGDKAAAMKDLELYSKVGGRNPATLKKLARFQEEAGKKREAAATLDRLNLIYLKDEELHKRLGDLWAALGNWSGAIREYQAVLATGTIDQAGGHFQLAQALKAAGRKDDAREHVLSALEAAPGFRPAQKLLLELNVKE
jgi:tetratricopeptide (TPR) repeat protein